MDGGILFVPHLILFVLAGSLCALTAPFVPWSKLRWRLLIALIPGSYVHCRLLLRCVRDRESF